MKYKGKKRLLLYILAMLIVSLGFLIDVLELIDLRLIDKFYQRPKPCNEDVIILGIDDESLSHLGRWPWKRNVIAQALELLKKGDPAAVGVDIIYSERSQSPADDEALVKAAEGFKGLVFSGYCTFQRNTAEGRPVILNIAQPFDELRAVSDFAIINVVPDNDGILRWAFLEIGDNDRTYNGFSYEIYKHYCERNNLQVIDKDSIPKDNYNRLYIDYSSKTGLVQGGASGGDLEHMSIYSLLNGDIDPEYFRDKIVLIGATSMGIPDDYYFTPMSPQSPTYGLEVHANVITQLIRGKFYHYMSYMTQFAILLTVGIIGWILARKVKTGWYDLSNLAFMIVFILFTFIMYQKGFLFSFIYPLVMIVLEYLMTVFFRFFDINRDRQNIKNLFGKYMAAEVIDQLIKMDKNDLKLGGQLVDITALFVDIRGFTSMSEKLQPEIVVSILNRYLTLCGTAIVKYKGTLDKYIGDCAMAIYNAPLAVNNHQLMAIMSGLAMREGSEAMNRELTEKYGINIDFGVGIHTGKAVVGNIGSDFRMDYTAIGDTVNTASRLQGQAKAGDVLISEEVYNAVIDYVDAEFVDSFNVKGKNEIINAYNVIGLK